jgi:diguanylate cyclase (GGDEF)-like protein/PAS domain S-box-containing protein
MLDMRSVLLVQILGLLVCFLILFMTWKQNRKRYNGLSCWTSMIGLSCVGYVLLALRDIAPDFISIIIANVLLVSGFTLYNRGIILFYGIKKSIVPSIIALSAVTFLQAFYTYYDPDIRARIIIISIALSIIYGHSLWLLLMEISPKQRAVSKALIWNTAIIILLNLYRIVVHVFFSTDQSGLLQQSFLDNLFLILQVPVVLMLVFNMIVLVSNFMMIEIQEEETKFNSIFQSAPYAAVITNIDDSKVIEANDEVLKLLEYDKQEFVGRTLLELGIWIDPNQRTTLIHELKIDGTINGRELTFRSKSGKVVPVLFSASIVKLNGKEYIVSTMKDISEIDRLKKELEELASHDMLTGLPNRRKFDEISAIQLARAARSREKMAMVMFDIDDFKCVNDDYGHDVGDKVLVAIADRLRSYSRSTDNVARHGGDEFTLLLNGLVDKMEAEVALIRLYKLFEEPIMVDGNSFNIGLSMGVAMYPENGVTTFELLSKADKALYTAKRKGKNTIWFASESESV